MTLYTRLAEAIEHGAAELITGWAQGVLDDVAAGRNSITGPAQFSLNAGITRTFPWGNRLNLDWRIDASNILNRVTYPGLNALVGSPQFGLQYSLLAGVGR